MINRLIATLLVYNGKIVQTKQFKPTNFVGDAFIAVDFFNSWSVDEICILEISKDESYLKHFIKLVNKLSERCFIPLSVGGKIKNLSTAKKYLRSGADKVVLNSGVFLKKNLLRKLSSLYGSQFIIVSIDVQKNTKFRSGYQIVTNNGSKPQDIDLLEWIQFVEKQGAGELLVNSIHNDGNRKGYDLDLLRIITSKTSLPVIAMGGVNKWSHLKDGISKGKVQSVAAGNIFHYSEHSTKDAKDYLIKHGMKMRPSEFNKIDSRRKIKY